MHLILKLIRNLQYAPAPVQSASSAMRDREHQNDERIDLSRRLASRPLAADDFGDALLAEMKRGGDRGHRQAGAVGGADLRVALGAEAI
jgi:hypothetical protein